MLDGGVGDDEIHDGLGDDLLVGGEEPSIGETDDDTFYHTTGDDSLYDLHGYNTYLVVTTDASEIIHFSAVQDVNGNYPIDMTVNGVPVLTDWQSIFIQRIGVLSNGGNDTITLNFGAAAVKDFYADGGDGDDIINVSTLQAKATLYGGKNNDHITGGLSDDHIYGGDGDDTIFSSGGTNGETVTGGDGTDTFNYEGDDTSEEIKFVGGSFFKIYVNGLLRTELTVGPDIETLGFDAKGGDDSVRFEALPLTLFANGVVGEGGAGNDLLNGHDGNSTLRGGPGNDFLYSWGGDAFLYGDDGDDHLTGRLGSDSLYGGNGDDVLDPCAPPRVRLPMQ